jgi:nucleoside-diphosphate-sugar epimerase
VPTVVITGAAGGVARHLLSALSPDYTLRPTDRRPLDFPGAVTGDLADPEFARRVSDGADAIVHLAADADPDQPWPQLRSPNADLLVSVLDAAVAAGVRKVVLASSLHALGGHVDAGRAGIGEDALPYPCCTYGALKVFAENMGRLYADLHGLSVICLRLGGVADQPLARSWLPGWLSGPDTGRLFAASLTAHIPYGVYHGVSANSDQLWRIDRTRAELGYQPLDDSAAYAARLPDDLSAPAGRRILHLT